jgi:hypothetical protein
MNKNERCFTRRKLGPNQEGWDAWCRLLAQGDDHSEGCDKRAEQKQVAKDLIMEVRKPTKRFFKYNNMITLSFYKLTLTPV